MTILTAYLATRQGVRIAATLATIGIAALPGPAGAMPMHLKSLAAPAVEPKSVDPDPLVPTDATGRRFIEEGVGVVDPVVERYKSLEAEKAALDELGAEIGGRYFLCETVREDAEETMTVLREIAGSGAPSTTRLKAMRGIAADFLQNGVDKALTGFGIDETTEPEVDHLVQNASQEMPGGFIGDVDQVPETERWRDHVERDPYREATVDWKSEIANMIGEIDKATSGIDRMMQLTSKCLSRSNELVAAFEGVARSDPNLTTDAGKLLPAPQEPTMTYRQMGR